MIQNNTPGPDNRREIEMEKKAQQKVIQREGGGSFHLRPNGTWELRIFDGFWDDGRRRYKSFYGKTQDETEEKLKAYQCEKTDDNNQPSFTEDFLFGDWANIYLDGHRRRISPTTFESYRYTLRILNRFFEHKRLNAIKAYDVEVMLDTLQQEGRSASSLAQCRGLMYQIMNKAEANDLILKNPVRFAEKMRYREPVKRKAAFTAEEVSILMERLPENRIGHSIRLMLGTGMRTQELLALQAEHIAEDGGVIQIRQALCMVKGSVLIGPPKSRDSYRDIPVPPNLRRCAVFLRGAGKQFIWESPKNPKQPINPSYFRDQFKKTLENIQGVQKLTPHCCRHTYVSQMQALGVDIAVIQSIVGHAEVDMTKHYLHVQREAQQRAIQLFSNMFSDEENIN